MEKKNGNWYSAKGLRFGGFRGGAISHSAACSARHAGKEATPRAPEPQVCTAHAFC